MAHRAPLLQITFISNEHDSHISVRVLPCVVKPRGEVVEGLTPDTTYEVTGHMKLTVSRDHDCSPCDVVNK